MSENEPTTPVPFDREAEGIAKKIFALYGDKSCNQLVAELDIERMILCYHAETVPKLAQAVRERDSLKAQMDLAQGELNAFSGWKFWALGRVRQLLKVLDDVTAYKGSASNALEDDYVMRRLDVAIVECAEVAQP